MLNPKRSLRTLSLSVLLVLFVAPRAFGEGPMAAGRGGPNIELLTRGLSAFDPELTGSVVVVGGSGFGFFSKNLRVGGGGGGGFVWGASEKGNFGMGYGGVILEYTITPYFNARLMIGGGGFSVSKVLTQSDTQITLKRIDSGGFVLFYPSVAAEVGLSSAIRLALNLGYFFPNVSKLQSFSVGINLMFGKL